MKRVVMFLMIAVMVTVCLTVGNIAYANSIGNNIRKSHPEGTPIITYPPATENPFSGYNTMVPRTTPIITYPPQAETTRNVNQAPVLPNDPFHDFENYPGKESNKVGAVILTVLERLVGAIIVSLAILIFAKGNKLKKIGVIFGVSVVDSIVCSIFFPFGIYGLTTYVYLFIVIGITVVLYKRVNSKAEMQYHDKAQDTSRVLSEASSFTKFDQYDAELTEKKSPHSEKEKKEWNSFDL